MSPAEIIALGASLLAAGVSLVAYIGALAANGTANTAKARADAANDWCSVLSDLTGKRYEEVINLIGDSRAVVTCKGCECLTQRSTDNEVWILEGSYPDVIDYCKRCRPPYRVVKVDEGGTKHYFKVTRQPAFVETEVTEEGKPVRKARKGGRR